MTTRKDKNSRMEPGAPPRAGADAYEIMAALTAAVKRFGGGADTSSAPDLDWVIEQLNSVDEWVLSSAAAAAGKLGLHAAVPHLIGLLSYGRGPAPTEFESGVHAYAEAAVSLESVDVRLGALRALESLLEPGDERGWPEIRISSEHPNEHPAVRSAACSILEASTNSRLP